MTHFDSDGVSIAYYEEGEGTPILLIHGFASNAHVNWVYPGWVRDLSRAGRRVISIDNRGHGDSEKLYDTDAYGAPTMAEDAKRLLDHLDIERADVMGYSMGARITAFLGLNHPDRVRSVIFGGLGYGMVTGVGTPEPIAEALEAPSLDDVRHATGRTFRQFAEQTGSDLKALAACMRSSRQKIAPEMLSELQPPALVAVGTRDAIAGSPQALADLIPNADVLHIPDRDHMLAVGDKVYKAGVMDFLARQD
ncbi:pimeloyl-ACP methyl ester carboxylesterase [Rhodobium orientis]|uniref:Alpha/beta hydrolase n=1 Tax=Rhodobium orientis TaxID=34017 RepID=A0A327JRJ8_9HYPH|nr:alpha/beta hydrolase [Rhodobium orientis]MBB4301707.1 pimeloyl-ACP methyl ester carboxylesterase [Rhodobium orientis]MBK5950510.1 alpha/beta hydrolase [Rhodobium orientis]RAI28156.1 alpha/beta hydrolase [Rhodobium orientis]